jgi:hypothetical protein
MSSYSFLDVSAVIDGPGGNFSIKEGTADEGISVDPVSNQNTMTEGANGDVMHSLAAGSAATVTLRLLKTSPVNAQLMQMFKHQTASAARHGQNVITIRDAVRGDVEIVSQAAFQKRPPNSWAKAGNIIEWVFDGGKSDPIMGTGTPEAV